MEKNYLSWPKPDFRREKYVLLNGEWDFFLENGDVGEREPRYKVFPENAVKINVPYAYQSELSGVEDKNKYETVWYHKIVKFDLKKDERAIIHFGAADYLTKLYINKKLVGEHLGGFAEFEFDITNYLINGEADIVVYCNDTYAINQPRGKQKWKDNPFGCWYQEITGIWKSVWVEIVKDIYISSFKITPLKNNKVQFEVLLNKEFNGELNINVKMNEKLSFDGNFKVNSSLFKEIISIDNIEYWSVEKPNLYDVSLSLIDSNIVDKVDTYFGYRFVEAKNQKIYVNDQPSFLKLVLEQGYYSKGIYTFENEQEMLDEIKLIKDLGFNGLRMHQKVEDPRFYYLCDKVGLYVWSEMPSSYEFDEVMVENTKREWKEILQQHYNHPSIIVWTPINECWGVPGIRHNQEQHQLLLDLYDMTKEFDSTRLVVSDDGWLHCKTDIVTLHNYIQDPERFKYFVDNVNEIVKSNLRMDDMNEFVPFADGFKYEGQPIMYDEFCGIGYDIQKVKEGWGYGTKVNDEDAFFDRLEGIVKAATDDKLAGWCVTQISDVYQEVNGLVTMDRKEKVDMKRLTKIISGK